MHDDDVLWCWLALLHRESNECKSASLSLESLYSFNSSGFAFRCCTFFSLHMHTRARVARICMWKERAARSAVECAKGFSTWRRKVALTEKCELVRWWWWMERVRQKCCWHKRGLEMCTAMSFSVTQLHRVAFVWLHFWGLSCTSEQFWARENCIKSQISGWIVCAVGSGKCAYIWTLILMISKHGISYVNVWLSPVQYLTLFDWLYLIWN